MKAKKIYKLIGATASMLTFLLITGVVSSTQVKAEVIDSTLQSVNKTTSQAAVLASEGKDYSIPVDKSFEDKGIKIQIKDITASKNEIRVKTLIHRNGTLNVMNHWNSIVNLVVQNAEQNVDCCSTDSKKIDDETVEYTFTIYNFKDFKNSLDLRFDVLLAEYDFNGWVKATVDISKYSDLTMEKDCNFNMENYEFYKLESNAIGTNLFYKEKIDNYDEEHFSGLSKVLLKYKDVFYCVDNRYIDDFDSINRYSIGAFSTDIIKIDDLNDVSEFSIVPIEADIKESEMEDYYKTISGKEPVYKIDNNVKYENKLELNNESSVSVDKVERTDGKVKVYYDVDSEKIGLLVGCTMSGHYDYKEDNHEYYNCKNKVIYKNPEKENSYIAEFNGVPDNKTFIVESDKLLISYADKFKVCDEVKIK